MTQITPPTKKPSYNEYHKFIRENVETITAHLKDWYALRTRGKSFIQCIAKEEGIDVKIDFDSIKFDLRSNEQKHLQRLVDSLQYKPARGLITAHTIKEKRSSGILKTAYTKYNNSKGKIGEHLANQIVRRFEADAMEELNRFIKGTGFEGETPVVGRQ